MGIEKVLAEFRAECPCEKSTYCPCEVFLRGFPERVPMQHKCVEMLKWMEGGKVGGDIGWDKAYAIWEERGYAKKFAEVYQDGMSHRELFELSTGIKLNGSGNQPESGHNPEDGGR